MSCEFKKIKMGHTPGDLPPEVKKKRRTRVTKRIVRQKTRAQQKEKKRQMIAKEVF